MKRLLGYLLQGLLYTAPIGITIYILYLVFRFVDGLLNELLERYIGMDIPGLGLIIIIILLIIIGFLGQTILAKPFTHLFDKLMKRIPILKVIHSAFNDLFSAFVGKERKFNKPVLVLVNKTLGLEKLGYLTEEDLSLIENTDRVAVYFPHSYNWSGELFLVPRELVRPIDVPPADVMKFIVSAGVADWD